MNFDEPGIKWQRVKRRTDSVFDYALSRNDERENKLIGRTLYFGFTNSRGSIGNLELET